MELGVKFGTREEYAIRYTFVATNRGYSNADNAIKLWREIEAMPQVSDLFGGAERDRTAGLLVAKIGTNELSKT
jgi:hypothetical protein